MAKSARDEYRKQMRERYMTNGFSDFQPDEVLEMMLFYGMPGRDTAELAHHLINKFGSLNNVLSTDPVLLQKEHIPENAAVLLSMFREVQRYTTRERLKGAVLDSYSKGCEYFADLYHYEANECVYAAILDEQLRVLTCDLITEGQPKSAVILTRPIIEMAVRCNASIVVLAHNHPSGSLKISTEDTAVTRQLFESLKLSGITMVDHVLVANQKAVSLRKEGVFMGLNVD